MESLGLGAVAAAGITVTGGALLAVDLRSARQGWRLRRHGDERSGPSDRRGDARPHEVGQVQRFGRRRGALEQRAEGGQGAVAESPHRHGKEGDIEAGLVDELLGFVDLGGMLDAAAGGRHTGGVLLGGQGRRGNHAPRCAERVVRLPREAGRKPDGEQQAQKQVTTDENDSQKKGPEF